MLPLTSGIVSPFLFYSFFFLSSKSSRGRITEMGGGGGGGTDSLSLDTAKL